jgi:hypothetical protein
MTTTPRVYQQGTSTVVIGSDDVQAACRLLGITADTHRWGSTSYGLFARRRGQWRGVSDYLPPKDARLGVCFHGPIRKETP